MIPNRLLTILRSCENDDTSHFPPTEIFNEGWMLRLVLDAVQTLGLHDHPLKFLAGARWYSEARLSSAFRPRPNDNKLGEGLTRADAVIGHFDFRPVTKSGLRLHDNAKQFVVVEAKMFSNLAIGTTNARSYDQAARNVACMAEAISSSGKLPSDFERLGFFVIAPKFVFAPKSETLWRPDSNLKAKLDPNSIRTAVNNRIKGYEEKMPEVAAHFRDWERTALLPLVERLVESGCLQVLSWEDSINAVRDADRQIGDELNAFYKRCGDYAPGGYLGS